MAEAVLDASALVDFLVGTDRAGAVAARMSEFADLHAPAHLDAEVLSALGRLQRAGVITAGAAVARLKALAAAPIHRHALAQLLVGAWQRRDRLRLVDALYVELAASLRLPLLTTDARLASAAGLDPIAP